MVLPGTNVPARYVYDKSTRGFKRDIFHMTN